MFVPMATTYVCNYNYYDFRIEQIVNLVELIFSNRAVNNKIIFIVISEIITNPGH